MSDTDPYYAGPSVEKARKVSETEEVETPKAAVEEVPEVSEKAAEGPEKAELTVPEGSVKKILEWVGNDKQKAQAALDAEADGDNRSTLISKLKETLEKSE